jgi:hypothetical protein
MRAASMDPGNMSATRDANSAVEAAPNNKYRGGPATVKAGADEEFSHSNPLAVALGGCSD